MTRRITGSLAVTCVTLGLITWPLAFNLGAYGEVFYDDIFRIVVASSVLFVITTVTPPHPSPWIWVVRAALISPLAWMLTAAFVVGSTSEALERPEFVIWLVAVVIVSVPFSLRLLIDLFAPELAEHADRRSALALAALVVAIGVIGFSAGRNNDRFLTCYDFAVAGSSEPDNCDPTG